MALAYLLSILTAVAVLAVTLRRRPVPTPPPLPPTVGLPPGAEAEVRLILVAAAQLAARLVPAA